MNKLKMTVTTTLLCLSLMSLSTYSYELSFEQIEIEKQGLSAQIRQLLKWVQVIILKL